MRGGAKRGMRTRLRGPESGQQGCRRLSPWEKEEKERKGRRGSNGCVGGERERWRTTTRIKRNRTRNHDSRRDADADADADPRLLYSVLVVVDYDLPIATRYGVHLVSYRTHSSFSSFSSSSSLFLPLLCSCGVMPLPCNHRPAAAT
jgi:hypothetical protein